MANRQVGDFTKEDITPEMVEAVVAELRLLDPLRYDIREVAHDAIKAVLANLPPHDR